MTSALKIFDESLLDCTDFGPQDLAKVLQICKDRPEKRFTTSFGYSKQVSLEFCREAAREVGAQLYVATNNDRHFFLTVNSNYDGNVHVSVNTIDTVGTGQVAINVCKTGGKLETSFYAIVIMRVACGIKSIDLKK